LELNRLRVAHREWKNISDYGSSCSHDRFSKQLRASRCSSEFHKLGGWVQLPGPQIMRKRKRGFDSLRDDSIKGMEGSRLRLAGPHCEPGFVSGNEGSNPLPPALLPRWCRGRSRDRSLRGAELSTMGMGGCQVFHSIDLRKVVPSSGAMGDRARGNVLPLTDRGYRFPTIRGPIAPASARVRP
jgi:hypothetical protein